MKIRKDRPWNEYPIGTKAHSCTGGYWTRTEHGWQAQSGCTFPTPGGDAVGACIELPEDEWHAAEMPDDALDPTSLVGSILNPEPVPELIADALQFMEAYDSDLQAMADREKAEQVPFSEPGPLWAAINRAATDAAGKDFWQAGVIEALRDWLPRRPPKEFYGQLCAELQTYDVTMVGRTMDWLHELLTEQARIARGEP